VGYGLKDDTNNNELKMRSMRMGKKNAPKIKSNIKRNLCIPSHTFHSRHLAMAEKCTKPKKTFAKRKK
jgi:hypothetical protein